VINVDYLNLTAWIENVKCQSKLGQHRGFGMRYIDAPTVANVHREWFERG